MDVLPSDRVRNEKLADMRDLVKARINPAVMDVAFTGDAISCDPEICKIMEEDYQWRERQGYREAGNYKYVLDVSGLFSSLSDQY